MDGVLFSTFVLLGKILALLGLSPLSIAAVDIQFLF